MRSIYSNIALLLPLTVVILAGCSSSDSTANKLPSDNPPEEFSIEDRKAARALSIGDDLALDKVQDPGSQARMCSLAIEDITAKLRQTGGLTNAQLSALEGARRYYARQASSPRERVSDDAAFPSMPGGSGGEDANANPGNDVRIAIACLRRLQESQV